MHSASDLTCRSAPFIAQVRLYNFRCYTDYTVQGYRQGLTLLTGGNGTGKTSILEALSLLLGGRGLRRTPAADMARWQSAHLGWRIDAQVQCAAQTYNVTQAWDYHKQQRYMTLNSDNVKQSALKKMWPLLWLSPEQDRLFAEGKEPRRSFVDRLLSALQPNYENALETYQHKITERLKVLQHPTPDARWLNILEQQAAQAAGVMMHMRAEFCVQWQQQWQLLSTAHDIWRTLTVQPIGDAEQHTQDDDAPQIAHYLQTHWYSNRQHDALCKMTQQGPHRTGYEVLVNGHDARFLSSGEQKLLTVLLFVTACLTSPHPPMVLIDDATSYLDPARAQLVLDIISQYLPRAVVSVCGT